MPTIRTFLLILLVLLSACGGGGPGPVQPAPGEPGAPAPAEPTIRFAATLSGGTLTVAPITGAASIGTRPIASVQLKVDDGKPQVLTAPTTTNATGQPLYVFAVPPATGPELPLPRCGFYRTYELTVTDAAGLSLTRYQASCGLVTFGAFSDYGERSVVFRLVSSSAPFDLTFTRQGGNAGEYVDSASFQTAGGARVWTVPAREGDRLWFSGNFPASAPDDARATLAVESGGVAMGTIEAARTTAGSLMIVCCRGTGAPGPAQPVTFFVYPTALGPFPQDPNPPFTADLRVVDAQGRTVHSFSGTAYGNREWTYPAAPGDQLHMEVAVGDRISANLGIRIGTAEIASGHASIPGAPTRFDLSCCAAPRF